MNAPPEFAPSDDRAPIHIRRRDLAKAALFPILLIALYSLARALGLKEWIERDGAVEAFIARWGWRAPLVFIAAYTLLPLAFVPRTVLALAAGFVFGWPSALYTWIGALLGESIAYAISSHLARPLLEKMLLRRAGERGRRAAEWLRVEGFWAVLVLRLLPIFPTDAVNYGAGMAGVRYRDYLAGTAIGIALGCVFYSYFGQLLRGGAVKFTIHVAVLWTIQMSIGIAVARARFRARRVAASS